MILVKFNEISKTGKRQIYRIEVSDGLSILANFDVITNPKCGWKSLLGAAARQLAKTKEGVSGAVKEKPKNQLELPI